MANVILPFLMSMLLGRTIDLTTYRVGGNVYDDAEYEETSVPSLNASYHVLQGDAFPYTFFGLPADIVLRIKTNFLSSSSGSMGLDGLLRDTTWKYNSAVICITAIRRTVDRKLMLNATLLTDWKEKIQPSQTHYVSSLFYGGWIVVLVRFQCDIPGDVEAVRKTITEAMGVIGPVNDKLPELHEKVGKAIKANTDIRGKVVPSIHLYSSVPIKVLINSPETIVSAIKGLPEAVGLKGQPLFMNLKPLNDLDKKYPIANENIELLNDVEKLEKMHDDVKVTKSSMMKWISDTMATFSDEEEEKIYKLLNKLNVCIRAFSKVGGEISLFKSITRDSVEFAVQTYLKGLERGVDTYNLAYRTLKEEIDAECENNFLHKIRGLLKVYDHQMIKKGEVKGGLQECQRLCVAEKRCKAIGYAEHLSELDLSTGLYFKKQKQCWLYFRSTSTAIVNTPNGLSGDLGIYDRICY